MWCCKHERLIDALRFFMWGALVGALVLCLVGCQSARYESGFLYGMYGCEGKAVEVGR